MPIHNIRGKKYKLKYVTERTIKKYCEPEDGEGFVIGLCDDPTDQDPQILIDKELRGRQMLKTLIHEVCHAYNWRWSEKTVESIAQNLGDVLYDNGYRKVK